MSIQLIWAIGNVCYCVLQCKRIMSVFTWFASSKWGGLQIKRYKAFIFKLGIQQNKYLKKDLYGHQLEKKIWQNVKNGKRLQSLILFVIITYEKTSHVLHFLFSCGIKQRNDCKSHMCDILIHLLKLMMPTIYTWIYLPCLFRV